MAPTTPLSRRPPFVPNSRSLARLLLWALAAAVTTALQFPRVPTVDITASEQQCVPLGRPLVTVACWLGGPAGTPSYFVMCTRPDRGGVGGDVHGRLIVSDGMFFGCTPVSVSAPGRGYTVHPVAPNVKDPLLWVNPARGRINACEAPRKDPGAKGPKAGRVDPKAARALATAPYGTRDPDGTAEPQTAVVYGKPPPARPPAQAWRVLSYCDSHGLPSLVALCNMVGVNELLHFCSDHERGWWYDLFGNQMADDTAGCYCHVVGFRVPPTRYWPHASGRRRPIRRPGLHFDYSPHPAEYSGLAFNVDKSNPWAYVSDVDHTHPGMVCRDGSTPRFTLNSSTPATFRRPLPAEPD
ncbi:hypothetical protein HIM_11995 [Hirsutella minnesotensis 3608]|uniref:Ig-like domain-containing protein n=1 Tax=Hirsutella minnesotensis 3608 TaxID=1043627 RepID=A0A0F7ZF68_9HYPO|nr:hypothetical protein HIM_11995 [Hirsutella minnesotensis 3608]